MTLRVSHPSKISEDDYRVSIEKRQSRRRFPDTLCSGSHVVEVLKPEHLELFFVRGERTPIREERDVQPSLDCDFCPTEIRVRIYKICVVRVTRESSNVGCRETCRGKGGRQ